MKVRMITESPTMRLLRPMPFAQLCVSVVLLSTAPTPALSSQETPEQRLACTPDVMTLCSAFIPNADEIAICLRENNANLNEACRATLDAGFEQPPNASDSTRSDSTTK
jgi:hypothetical protein